MCRTSAKMCAEGRVCSTQIAEKMDLSATSVQEAFLIGDAQNNYNWSIINFQTKQVSYIAKIFSMHSISFIDN